MFLNDVNAQQPFEIHFSLGHAQVNFWQYDIGFVPPHNQWAEYVISLSSSLNWTQIIGTGSFANALMNVDRFHFRHDLAPYMQSPDAVARSWRK